MFVQKETPPHSNSLDVCRKVLPAELTDRLRNDVLSIVTVNCGACVACCWIRDACPVASYEGFGGELIAFYDFGRKLITWESQIDSHGQFPRPALLNRLKPGMTTDEVEGFLGKSVSLVRRTDVTVETSSCRVQRDKSSSNARGGWAIDSRL